MSSAPLLRQHLHVARPRGNLSASHAVVVSRARALLGADFAELLQAPRGDALQLPMPLAAAGAPSIRPPREPRVLLPNGL